MKEFFNAVRSGDIESLRQQIANGTDVNSSQDMSWTALHSAICLDQVGVVDLLTKVNGIDIDALTDDGCSPLALAAQLGRIECGRLLIERGASPTAAEEEHNSPYSWAYRMGEKQFMQLLENSFGPKIAVVVDIPVVKMPPEDQLLRFLGDGNDMPSELLKLLEPVGTNITLNANGIAGGEFEVTPLMLAASRRMIRCSELLLKIGADAKHRDHLGFSALDYAIGSASPKISRILSPFLEPANKEHELMLFAQDNNLAHVKKIVESGVSINSRINSHLRFGDATTPMEFASSCNCFETLVWLHSAGGEDVDRAWFVAQQEEHMRIKEYFLPFSDKAQRVFSAKDKPEDEGLIF